MSDEPKRPRVFLAIPNYGNIDHETWSGILDAVGSPDGPSVFAFRSQWSLLAHNFNECWAMCVNEGTFDYFAMLHADMGVSQKWLKTLVDECESGGFDVMHGPAAIKNHDGLTSTAIAYDDDEWSVPRRLTMTELHKLPETFGVDEVRAIIDADARWLLPNTGCMLVRLGDWSKSFPGFQILDRIEEESGKLDAKVVPEDWNFGYWCGRNGLKVGATRKVVTKHIGRASFDSDKRWGVETDAFWAQQKTQEVVCQQ